VEEKGNLGKSEFYLLGSYDLIIKKIDQNELKKMSEVEGSNCNSGHNRE